MSCIYRITVGQAQGDITGSTNTAIQSAVDRAAAMGGGDVRILPGTYEMHDSLHLRTGVVIHGSGADTVLRKIPSVQSLIPAFLGYGHYDISVVDPAKFQIGMGVLIQDDESRGFYDTVGTLTWQDGNRFGIDSMLNHDYHVNNHATVTSVYPVVSACNVRHAEIADLVIDGNRAHNGYLNGCRGGGIYLLQAHHIAIRNVVVRDFNGDGISFQQCAHTLIEDCLTADNAGHGLHPGSGSVAPVIRRCNCLSNGDDGIFYCLRVTYSLCEQCDIAGNGHDGISIGERDSYHLIRNNKISASGRHGIFFRETVPTYGGDDNVIEGNRIFANCRREGNSEVFVSHGIRRLQILRNHFGPGERQMVAVYVEDGCEQIAVAGNDADLIYRPTVRGAEAAGVSLQIPSEPLPVGPERVPAGGLLHLNIRPGTVI